MVDLDLNSVTPLPLLNTTPNNHSFSTTTEANTSPYPTYVGYICALVAVLMYGSNFVPVKKYFTGDGLFFQWVLCCGIFLVGLIIQQIQQSKFYPLVMLGGAIWATGNLCVVPVFKTIGMGLGMSIWGTIALLSGWASGKFGWFDTTPDKIGNVPMNYGGVGMALLSILLYLMVKSEVSGKTEMEIVVEEENDPLIPPALHYQEHLQEQGASVNRRRSEDILVFNKNHGGKSKFGSRGDSEKEEEEEEDEKMFIEMLSPTKKKVIGTVLSVLSGFMYGINFMPTTYIQKTDKNSSKNGLDYVFAQFCGIYLASTVYFAIYCMIKKNKPKVFPQVILPAIVSGIMWAIATGCWFIANAELSQSVTFPIISTAPAAIASLFWGVIVFHEIKGKKNILFLLLAFCIMACGAVLAGLSK